MKTENKKGAVLKEQKRKGGRKGTRFLSLRTRISMNLSIIMLLLFIVMNFFILSVASRAFNRKNEQNILALSSLNARRVIELTRNVGMMEDALGESILYMKKEEATGEIGLDNVAKSKNSFFQQKSQIEDFFGTLTMEESNEEAYLINNIRNYEKNNSGVLLVGVFLEKAVF